MLTSIRFQGLQFSRLEYLTAAKTFHVAAVFILRNQAGAFVFAGRIGHGSCPGKNLRAL